MKSVFRTPEQQTKYDTYRAAGNLDGACALCGKEHLKEFKNWRVVENLFPYDKIAKVHNMILPKRHVAERGLNDDERKELADIKQSYLEKEYDFIIEAMPKMKSIPDHFHIHLVLAKDQ